MARISDIDLLRSPVIFTRPATRIAVRMHEEVLPSPPSSMAMPSSLLVAGDWSFDMGYQVHDGWGNLHGEGESIEQAIAHAFEDDAGSNEAIAWEGSKLQFNGVDFLERAVEEERAARDRLLSMSPSVSGQHAIDLVLMFQKSHEQFRHAMGLMRDLEWMFEVIHGEHSDRNPDWRTPGQPQWLITPRLLQGETSPCVPGFLQGLKDR